MAGSNELNLLLTAKVVKVKVELDIKGSKLVGQVNKISDYLKDKRVKLKVELLTTGLSKEVQKINNALKGKNAKLDVKLHFTKTSINSQLKDLNTLINQGANMKSVKVGLNIDIKGSATKIKAELAQLNRDIQAFNANYKKMIDETNRLGSSSNKKNNVNNTNVNAIQNAYARNLIDAKQYMKEQYGKGTFTSRELKDANGALVGFMATLTKANGVVQQIKYKWDSASGSFTPINRTTVTNTEKNVKQAMNALKKLDKEIMGLGKNQEKFWNESNALREAGKRGTLTKDAVDSLKQRIADEKALQREVERENKLLTQQRELLRDIAREKKNTNNRSLKTELGNLKNNVTSVNLDDKNAKATLNSLRRNLTQTKQDYSDVAKKEREAIALAEKRRNLIAEIARMQRTSDLTNGTGAGSKRYVKETQEMAKAIKTTEQYNQAMRRMSNTNRALSNIKIDNDIEKQLGRLQTAMYKFATTTGMNLGSIETRFAQVSHAVKNNLATVTQEVEKYNRMTEKYRSEQNLKARQSSILQLNSNAEKNKKEHENVNNLVLARNNNALKEYIANLNGANVAMMRMVTSSNGVTRITAQLASTKKTAKELTYEIDQVDKKLRLISTADVFNANRNLGIFEQLKIAMSRVPVWMVAMTAFHSSIRTVQNVTQEILKLDKAMTELRRVADSQIDVGYMFEGAIKLSKELGNNIHDVMASINDLARTFGHFNERQLLAIANTATLMSNVSDLNAQEATESLVGTMNAFNITAEDSIRIVDSMNEVDNNYAIKNCRVL